MDLTNREEQVLNLLADGKTRSEIATTLGIAASTVGTFCRLLLVKTGSRNVQSLVRWAIREGLVKA